MTLSKWKELFLYREMLKNLILRDLRTRYKGSILGFVWTFLNPLLMLVIYTIAFKTIMRMNIPNYSIFLFSGLLPWLYLQSTVSLNTSIIVGNSGLVKKVYFPYQILPLSATVAGAVNYIFSLSILLIAMLFFGMSISIKILLFFPLILFIQMVLVHGLSLLLSALNVYFRDIQHIIGIVFMAWFYLTPIFYPLSMVPTQYQSYFHFNPMTTIMQAYQDIFYYNETPQLGHILGSFVYSLTVLILGSIVFHMLKKRFAEEL